MPAATKVRAEAYAWEVLTAGQNFGELIAGQTRVMLSVEAMVAWGKVDGIILHDYVDDVPAAVARAVAAGVELIEGPLTTDWGTEAAYLKGPGNLIVDLCKNA